MLSVFRKEFQYGRHRAFLETGLLARQADAAVLVGIEDTVVLATVVTRKEVSSTQNFFPLTVDYIEKTYAAGRIPGGFFKREGRASEKEILTARLIDRPLRPLFANGFLHDVHVVVSVLSVHPEIDPDIPAIIAASAAVAVSGVPFAEPLAAARVGFMDGQYILNPTVSELKNGSQLDLVVAATSSAIVMVESAAQELSENIMLGAIMYGHEQMQVVIDAIHELVEKAGKTDWEWVAPEKPQHIVDAIAALAEEKLKKAYYIREKPQRLAAVAEICAEATAAFFEKEDTDCPEQLVKTILFDLQSRIVRSRILAGEPRIDGRCTRTVRPIDIRIGVLPRTHGSVIFTRGETQALVVTTLGTESDGQIVDGLVGENKDYFLFHYNMPPYATGEVGRMGPPKRREIGHGRLSRRALACVLPDKKNFPYTLRIVSEVTESNGSSSMASVCGGCLSLMDAGVPVKTHVSGIAMGLIKEGNKFAILTDILGDEDHLGDMDFKVTGTVSGVTSLQMDIKITGITKEIMEIALMQAKQGRLHILEIMKDALAESRSQLSLFAPRVVSIKINPDKIHIVIGKGGATIKALTEQTGATVDIQDDGTITIAAVNADAVETAKKKIQMLTADVEVNKIYEGKIVKLFEFGVVIDIMPGRDGLLHVSQIMKQRAQAVNELFTEGQVIRVKVIGFDEKGRPRLSTKDL